MSEFVEVEWFGREQKIGIVLTYDEHDGFKVRMAPLSNSIIEEWSKAELVDNEIRIPARTHTEDEDVRWLMQNAAKVPFEWAWGIFGPRMETEWMQRHLGYPEWPTVRYNGVDYDINTLEEVS